MASYYKVRYLANWCPYHAFMKWTSDLVDYGAARSEDAESSQKGGGGDSRQENASGGACGASLYSRVFHAPAFPGRKVLERGRKANKKGTLSNLGLGYLRND